MSSICDNYALSRLSWIVTNIAGTEGRVTFTQGMWICDHRNDNDTDGTDNDDSNDTNIELTGHQLLSS